MARGKLIVICGVDGAGKTTLEKKIITELNKRSYSTLATKQPTDKYRQHSEVRRFLDTGKCSFSMETLATLSASDRMVHIDSIVKPALEEGKWVICNRYVYSAYAYFINRGVEMSFLSALNQKVLQPDLGILLDLSAHIACARIENRDGAKRKHEEKKVFYMEKVRKTLLNVFPKDFLILDANHKEETLLSTAMEYINEHKPIT